MSRHYSKSTRPFLIGLAVLVGLAVGPRQDSAKAAGHICSRHCVHCPPPPPPPCPTVLTAGPSPEDLQVHIVDPNFGTIEAYFREELYRETLLGAINLHCNNSVLLAPKSTNNIATFAVRFGPNYDSFKVYGWRQTDTKAPVTYGPITLEPGSPIALYWITPQILKVTYGPQCSKEHILKFTGGDQPWRVLYSSDSPPQVSLRPSVSTR